MEGEEKMKTREKLSELDKIFQEKREMLETSIRLKKSYWIKKNLAELIAKIAIFGKDISNIESPKILLDEAKETLEKWFLEKTNDGVNFTEIENFYDSWSKVYDSESNVAFPMEKRVLPRWFKYSGKKILDLGCGTGRYSIPLSRRNSVLGIDVSGEMLKIAREKAKKEKVNATFLKEDITKYSPKKKFDVIISMLVQDHIADLKKVSEVMSKASKIGTEIIISNIHPIHTMKSSKNLNRVKLSKTLNLSTNQYYHPLSEYMSLLVPKGFVLEDYAEPIFLEKDARRKEFRYLKKLAGKPIVSIYKFRRLK
jgi:2-polyprenyl-3-methyl-5-hydroxy-6-metoxy-1,4-benzoquinol methylase